MVELLGYAAGFFATMSCLPQVIKSWRTRSVGDLSMLMLLMIVTGLALWIAYGVARNNGPIILWNTVSLGLWSSLLVLKLRAAKGDT
jgi:MtN3 and saliva related transmembrane protein